MKIAKYLLDFTGMLMASKQWGFKQSAGQTTSIDFPIPFTTNDYTIVVCQGMNVTNEWGANYYVLVGTKQLNSINAFTTAPYSNGGNVVFWIALNSQKQWSYPDHFRSRYLVLTR